MAEQGSLDCLVVVGTGFMGASLAKAVKQAGLARHVIGVDPTSASAAASIGVIDQAASSIAELSNCAFKEIAVVVASPVNTYATVFEALAKFSAALKDGQSIVWVTDLGSTKEGVVKAASLLGPLSSRFVSSDGGLRKAGPCRCACRSVSVGPDIDQPDRRLIASGDLRCRDILDAARRHAQPIANRGA